jgi:hypothetical protein
VIRSEIYLCHRRRFPILKQHGDFLLRYRLHVSVGGGRCECSAALRASHCLGAEGSNIVGDEGSLVNLTSHGGVGPSAVQQAVNEKQNA